MIREFTFNEVLFILTGLKATLALSALVFACVVAGNLVVALCRTSRLRPLAALTSLYIDVFRGTPLLMQLFVACFALARFS